MRIEHGRDSYIEIEQSLGTVFAPDGILTIEVTDFGGSFDNPWRTASITLTTQEEEQLYNYLRQRYIEREKPEQYWVCKNGHRFNRPLLLGCPTCGHEVKPTK